MHHTAHESLWKILVNIYQKFGVMHGLTRRFLFFIHCIFEFRRVGSCMARDLNFRYALAFARNLCSVLHAVWHACVTLHLTPISDVPDRVPRWALILRVACVGNRFARVLVPCAAQQGDPTSAGVNQGESRRRFTACGRHDSGPPHCPTVFPPHRRKPGALCDR